VDWNNVRVSDALYAMYHLPSATSNGTRVKMKDCNLLENVFGIYQNRHNTQVSLFENNELRGCEECLLKCGCHPGVGITLDHVPNVQYYPKTGVANEIWDFVTGVENTNTSLNMKNFYIHHVTETGLWYKKTQAVRKDLAMDFMHFAYMPTAVLDNVRGGNKHFLWADASVAKSSLYIEEVTRGYDIQTHGTFLDGSITENHIYTNGGDDNFGIKVSSFASTGNIMDIKNNYIEANGGTVNNVGIALNADQDAWQNANIEENEIKTGGTRDGGGIHISNWQNTGVYHNIIEVGNRQEGIEFNNGGFSHINCNHAIDGDKGLYFTTSQNNNIYNNHAEDNQHSLYIEGDCMGQGTVISFNQFDDSDNSSCYYNGFTGAQMHEDYNQWLDQDPSDYELVLTQLNLKDLVKYKAPIGSVDGDINHPLSFPQDLILDDGSAAGGLPPCEKIG
jgi:hypothetical protein